LTQSGRVVGGLREVFLLLGRFIEFRNSLDTEPPASILTRVASGRNILTALASLEPRLLSTLAASFIVYASAEIADPAAAHP
jgi:hypothetical protein